MNITINHIKTFVTLNVLATWPGGGITNIPNAPVSTNFYYIRETQSSKTKQITNQQNQERPK